MSEERRDKQGRLLGPKKNSEYLAWRRNRDKMIANPRRLQSVRDAEEKPKESSGNSGAAK